MSEQVYKNHRKRATTKVFVKKRCRILAYVYSYASEREGGERGGGGGMLVLGFLGCSSDKL